MPFGISEFFLYIIDIVKLNKNFMMSKNAKYLLTLAGGMAAGALIGLLFAPDKGSATRSKIKNKAKDMTKKLRKETEKMKNNMNKMMEREMATAN